MLVRFTDLCTKKVSFPTVRNEREARYVYKYAADRATAPFFVELLLGDQVIASQEIGVK